jgi:hypothetical protein
VIRAVILAVTLLGTAAAAQEPRPARLPDGASFLRKSLDKTVVVTPRAIFTLPGQGTRYVFVPERKLISPRPRKRR